MHFCLKLFLKLKELPRVFILPKNIQNLNWSSPTIHVLEGGASPIPKAQMMRNQFRDGFNLTVLFYSNYK